MNGNNETPNNNRALFTRAALFMVAFFVLSNVLGMFFGQKPTGHLPAYSEFYEDVKLGLVESVVFAGGGEIIVKPKTGVPYKVENPESDNSILIGLLLDKNVEVSANPPAEGGLLMQIFISWFPMLLLIAVWIFFMRQMQGGRGPMGAMGFGKSKARLLSEDHVNTTFTDVAGCDESKEEVSELVEFLRDPDKFQKLGGKIPRGVLMIGPPGCGKTMLSRAVAGEAKVPFFITEGSSMVEMFVGVGAARIRDMFDQAKKKAPCIVFIDEIDAVGRHRGAGLGGGHDEREQTLNQLLVEMDGFEGNEGVIILAATNRPDVLDPALLRPGRFDRQVHMQLPDIRGREQILNVHVKKLPSLHSNVSTKIIARGTPGFSGADLANLVNEAALFAASTNKDIVSMVEFEKAKDKILMGVEKKSMIISEDEKRITAYHESGHAIIGRLVPAHDPIYKVTIIPRGRALGVTMFLPETDHISYSKERLLSILCSFFGGRVAEAMILGEDKITTGASNDIERATDLARNMVTKWGLSDLGPIAFSKDEKEVFLGRSVTETKNVSEATAREIDVAIKKYINESYTRAEKILAENVDILHKMADALLEFETIESVQIDDIMARREVHPIEYYNKDKEEEVKSG